MAFLVSKKIQRIIFKEIFTAFTDLHTKFYSGFINKKTNTSQ